MTINAATGATLFIGAVQPARFPILSAYSGDLTYVEVGEIESIGNFGDKSSAINFTSLKDSRVRKLKGPRDAGSLALTVGDSPSDAGQLALIAAEATNFEYNFKVVLNDAITPSTGTASIHYFHGKVMGKELQVGSATNVVKRAFTVDINSPILEVDPT